MLEPNVTDNAMLHQLVDEAAIRGLCDRFADAANHLNYEAFRATWAAEGVWDIGEPMNVHAEGVDDIEKTLEQLLGEWEFFVQMPHAGAVKIQGERATARWTMNEIGRTRGDNPQSQFNLSTYTDELVKQDGKWLFTKRSYKMTYLDVSPLPGKVLSSDATRS